MRFFPSREGPKSERSEENTVCGFSEVHANCLGNRRKAFLLVASIAAPRYSESALGQQNQSLKLGALIIGCSIV